MPSDDAPKKCQKCGAELSDTQKVCVVCGAYTAAAGVFYEEEKKNLEIPPKYLWIGGAAIALILIIIILAKVLHVDPPETVAKQWAQSLANRQLKDARALTLPSFDESARERLMDVASLADDISNYVKEKNADIEVKEISETQVAMTSEAPANIKIFMINFVYPEGASKTLIVQIQKEGRHWKVAKLL
ncbi:MAG: zinc ribbon domain-containing protein [Armatimonadota bacterium]